MSGASIVFGIVFGNTNLYSLLGSMQLNFYWNKSFTWLSAASSTPKVKRQIPAQEHAKSCSFPGLAVQEFIYSAEDSGTQSVVCTFLKELQPGLLGLPVNSCLPRAPAGTHPKVIGTCREDWV